MTTIRHWRIIESAELIETTAFTRQITTLLRDGEYREFQSRLAANPELGPLIAGGGGIRKIVIYYWAIRKDVILLLYAYPKNEAAA